jgi:hypothetical protein
MQPNARSHFHCDGFHKFSKLPPELHLQVHSFPVEDIPARLFLTRRMPISQPVMRPNALPLISSSSK